MIWIGIDPGTHTGMAVWDSGEGKFLSLETLHIHRALERVREIADAHHGDVAVCFEDARQRKWYGRGNTSAKLQGAGSVKRDCSIWEDFCNDHCILYQAKAPSKGTTKVSPAYFEMISGWHGRTSEHARDAAMLVLGR